jgi:hypothetical protein
VSELLDAVEALLAQHPVRRGTSDDDGSST